MGIITWIIVGAIAGWLASKIMNTDAEMGGLANIVVGILGAVVGGWLLGAVFGFQADNLLTSIITAVVGAVILLWVYKMVTGRRGTGAGPGGGAGPAA